MQQMIFIADFIACSPCFGHHYAHHQELKSIIQMVAACGIWCFGFQVVSMVWCPVCRLQPANRTHNSSSNYTNHECLNRRILPLPIFTNTLASHEHDYRICCCNLRNFFFLFWPL